MTIVTSFPHGTPIWVDLQSADAEQATAFYRELLGWDVSEPTARSSGYRIASLGGVPVCAIGSLPGGLADKGAVSTWTTYLAVDDADGAAAAVTEAGGSVLLPPGELGGGVRLSIATDAVGAVVGLWQSAGSGGSWLRHEPGAVDWFELLTAEVESAPAFYQTVLGAAVTRMPMGESDYLMLGAGDTEFAGVGASDVDGLSSHWRVYFAVSDLAESVQLVEQLGGRVLVAPSSASGVGSWAAVADPLGAVFSLIQPEAATEASADGEAAAVEHAAVEHALGNDRGDPDRRDDDGSERDDDDTDLDDDDADHDDTDKADRSASE